MDDVDHAQHQEELQREAAAARRLPMLPACGACHNCGESMPPGRLFCDLDCRNDWQLMQDAKKRAGHARG